MNRQLLFAVCASGVLLVGACSSFREQSPPTPTASASELANVTGPAHVKTAQTPLGTILTDNAGRALYLFAADTGTTSTCAGDCAKEWPPLTTKGAPVAEVGANQALLSTTLRNDGGIQLTYNGHPLYYYDDDKGPGTTKGQGETSYGGNWYVLTPAGVKIDKD
jgi:predicted lipoprotein with Yx(FWY)xxD motif